MKSFHDYIKTKPHHIISIPAILCFIQFIINLWGVIKTGNFDSQTMNHLLASADGFEAVSLGIIMLALKNKKK